MKERIKNYLSIMTLTVFFIIGVASSHKTASFKDAPNWVPENFNPNNTVLLIQEHPLNNKQNERMIEYLEKNYPYRYEVVTKGIIYSSSGKYADAKTYQFGVLWEMRSSVRSHVGPNGHPYISTEWDLYGSLIDRSTSKISTTTRSNVYGQTGYIQFFNSILKQFK